MNLNQLHRRTTSKAHSHLAVNDEIRKQIIDFFPSYYMTLLSIIQATVFGYLLLTIYSHIDLESFDKLTTLEAVSQINIRVFLMSSGAFLVILEVWFEYMMGSLTMRWLPGFRDCILPFLLGMGEFSLVLSVHGQNISFYFLSLSLCCLVSFFAFKNMYKGIKRLDNNGNKHLLYILQKSPTNNTIFILVLASFFLVCTILYENFKYLDLASLFSANLLIGVFIRRGRNDWKKIISLLLSSKLEADHTP